jgi:integrase
VFTKRKKGGTNKGDKRLRFLSVEEAQGLVSICDDHMRPIVITALNTGMRRGEILGLKWENIAQKTEKESACVG